MPGIFLKENRFKTHETIREKVYAKHLLTSGLIITIEEYKLWTIDITDPTLEKSFPAWY